jgi:hypothetical protein
MNDEWLISIAMLNYRYCQAFHQPGWSILPLEAATACERFTMGNQLPTSWEISWKVYEIDGTSMDIS